jgi:hypothetical protein
MFRSGSVRAATFLGIAGITTFGALFALGTIGGDILAVGLLAFVLGPAPFVYYEWQESEGAVILDRDGICLKSSTTTITLAWEHIGTLELRAAGPDNFLGTWLAGGHRRYAGVKLLRRSRYRIWSPGRSGTDIFGLPLGPKTFRLHVQDPEGFLRAAEPFLNDQSVSGHRPSA